MKRALGSLIVAVVVATGLAACGNSGGKTDETKKAAAFVPTSALAYISVAVNPSDSQKSDIDGILAKFPKASKKTFDAARDDALTQAVKNLGLDYTQDVKPWLGDELSLAVMPNTPNPSVVGLIKSKDDTQATAALAKAAKSPNFDAAYKVVKGYAIVVQKKDTALLDTVARQADSGGGLAADAKFTRVVDKLSSDRVVTAWADGHALLALAKAELSRQTGKARINLDGIPDIGSAAADLHAVSSGGVLSGVIETPGSSGGGDLSVTNNLPSDSLGAISLWNLGGAFDSVLGAVLQSNPQASGDLNKAQQQLGLDIRQDVLSWMHGETVIALGPPTTGPTPDFALLVRATDTSKAQAAVAKINSVLTQKLGVKLDQRPGPNGSTMDVFPAPIRTGIQPAMALVGDNFILASSTDYLTRLAKGSGGFDGGSAFKDTLGSAEPGTQFQMVLQMSSIRQYIEGLLTGKSKQRYETDVKPWLDPFSAAAMRVRKDGSLTRFEMKATVK
ncbi:MAG: DUF3352 domain-containing protein [Acidimicrobiia bacterium]|nr:DUF3352 domain-containing protein [Acidimicrobiia bacterium]